MINDPICVNCGLLVERARIEGIDMSALALQLGLHGRMERFYIIK